MTRHDKAKESSGTFAEAASFGELNVIATSWAGAASVLGNAWSRLKVTFQSEIATRSSGQVFYFDRTGLLRRQDYTADVIGVFLRLTIRRSIRNFLG